MNCSPRSQCLALDWDKDGESLAVLQKDSAIVPLWDAHQHKTSHLDTNMKDLTFLKWSLTGPQVSYSHSFLAAVGRSMGT